MTKMDREAELVEDELEVVELADGLVLLSGGE